jgi:DNA-binding MarR family transcriptional regulator
MAKKHSDLDEEILKFHNPRNVGRLLRIWRRYFDDWANKKLDESGYGFFKMAYMPFIMNISPEGSTNNEIAVKARVSKQAMSKVVKQLVEHGLIRTEEHGQDARASIIFLTIKGKEFVIEVKKRCLMELDIEYRTIVGEKNYEIMLDSMLKIVEYHDQKEAAGNKELNSKPA